MKPLASSLICLILLLALPVSSRAAPRPRVRVNVVDNLLVDLRVRARRRQNIQWVVIQIAAKGSRFKDYLHIPGSLVGAKIAVSLPDADYFRIRARAFVRSGQRSRWSRVTRVVFSEHVPDVGQREEEELELEEWEKEILQQQEELTQITLPDWPSLPSTLGECQQGADEALIDLVNSARAELGIPELARSYHLSVSSRNHSIWMATEDVLSHEGWFGRILATGMQGSAFAQNVAFGFEDPQWAMNGFMASPPHAKNILNPRLQFIGISCVSTAQGRYYWTQDFGGQ